MLRMACRAHAEAYEKKYIEIKTSMGSVNRFSQSAGFSLMGTNDQLAQGSESGGGNIGSDREDADVDRSRRIRKLYEFILDTEDELGVELDY